MVAVRFGIYKGFINLFFLEEKDVNEPLVYIADVSSVSLSSKQTI